MNKKKAIKIAAATAIAASAFTAVAPAQSEAAVSVKSQVKTAQTAMKKPYNQYTKSLKTPATASVIKKQIAAAKTAQTKINTVIKKSTYSTKTKNVYYAQVKSYSVYITRAQGYLTAISLKPTSAQTVLEAALESENLADVVAARIALNTKLYQFNKAVERVYSTPVRKLLTSTYATPAKAAIIAADQFIDEHEGDAEYAETKKAVEAKVDAYVALANGDLTTQAKVDAAKAAKVEIDLTKLNDADKAEFQTEIDAADEKVAAAVAVDTTELDQVISDFDSVKAEAYTAESYAAYKTAVDAAKTVKVDANNATQAQVDAAVKTVTDAKTALEAATTDKTAKELNATILNSAPGVYAMKIALADAQQLGATEGSTLTLKVEGKADLTLTYNATAKVFINANIQGYTQAELESGIVSVKEEEVPAVKTTTELNATILNSAPGVYAMKIALADAQQVGATEASTLTLKVEGKADLTLTYNATAKVFINANIQGYTQAELQAATVSVK